MAKLTKQQKDKLKIALAVHNFGIVSCRKAREQVDKDVIQLIEDILQD